VGWKPLPIYCVPTNFPAFGNQIRKPWSLRHSRLASWTAAQSRSNNNKKMQCLHSTVLFSLKQ
jgi:hypothetical protein